MKQTLSITRKELNSYFSSPMALIFVGVFLAVTLFTFFWVDDFFARGIADLRPLFRWMPTLMIFLVAALTMRQWSEEQQTGTLEILFTMPIKLFQLVLGKFLAVLALVAVALLLTIFLPITISRFGNPDAGPIIGGYLAAILLASAYIAIGLFVSSCTVNQIVSLIATVLICGLFQMVGSHQITDQVNSNMAEILRGFGTGSRFESIERGVIDLRDLAFYLSLTLVFLALNVFWLDRKRWGKGAARYRLNMQAGVTLVVANLLALNIVLFPLNTARLDLTQNHEYTLSDATRHLLKNLQEPLLIRFYYSEKNHPYLSPLIPTVRDMLDEYKIAAGNKLKVEFVDPIKDPDKAAEASQIYGIEPTPLQVQERYGESMINVYFDILIRYGDQSVVLNFRDLITIDEYGNGDFDVRLRNLEYDLTRNIKKVVYGFQSIDAVLASLKEPAQMTLYYTPDTLPDSLKDAPATIESVAQKISAISNGKFTYQLVNVNDPNSGVTPQSLYNQYQIQPVAESFLSTTTYYLHIVLIGGNKAQVIYPTGAISETEIRSSLEAALQRAAPGFLKTVGLWIAPNIPQVDMFGQSQPGLQSYQNISDMLSQNYEVRTISLLDGEIPADIDVLVLVAPENLTDIERYAVDQYLMRGGTVFVAAGNYKLTYDQYMGMLGVQPIQNGLQDMLDYYGVRVEPSMVLDPQNVPFPLPTVSGQIQIVNYPYLPDIRSSGMDRHNPIASNLISLTFAWASPITVDSTKNEGRKVTVLLKSSAKSWVSTNMDITPNTLYNYGFVVEKPQQSYPLAVIVEGSFDSYFKGKSSPFPEPTATPEGQATPTSPDTTTAANPQPGSTGLIETSPKTARLIVVGSSEFLDDTVLQVLSSYNGNSYLNNYQFIQNAVDWATEDTDLLSIRSRGTTSRILNPLTDKQERRWEIENYLLALSGLVVLGILWQVRRRSEKPMVLITPEPITSGTVEHEQV